MELPEEVREKLSRETAILLGCTVDEVTDEDVEIVQRRGWSATVKGKPYCLYCGLRLADSIEELKGRKFCGVCRQSIDA